MTHTIAQIQKNTTLNVSTMGHITGYHTNRLKQEILCWKYQLVYRLGKIRTHWHTKKAEKDIHSSGMSLAFICPNYVTPGLPPSSRRAPHG